jgi:pyruvate ferredoxin oxidoreductase beta subunit
MAETALREPRELFSPGHTACAGCGQALAARLLIEAAGPNTIVANSTGCLEVFTTRYPESAWNVPWIHSLFENSSAVASGVEMALRAFNLLDSVHVIAQAGDGGTADIGFGAISGTWERGHDVLVVCYDNEAYMNTGIQRSSLTPYDSNTTTSPPGKRSFGNPLPKKNMPEMAVAHRLPYVATASPAFPRDLQRKVKKALSVRGPKYLQIHCPCPLGWRHEPGETFSIGVAVVETGLYPLLEWENGKLTRVHQVEQLRPVEDYLKPQGRFRHLFRPGAEAELEKVRELARQNAERYGLVKPAAAKAKPGAAPSAEAKPQAEPQAAKPAPEAAKPAPPTAKAPSAGAAKAGAPSAPPAPAKGAGAEAPRSEKVMTREELARCDGKDGRPACVAYRGVIYDVTKSTSWSEGLHYDTHMAGRDLTRELDQAPHGDELLKEFPVVGKLAQS